MRTERVPSGRTTLDAIRLFRLVRAGKGWVIVCIATMTSAAIAARVFLPATYTASAAVLVDVSAVGALDTNASASALSQRSVLATHANLVRSERVARRVVSELKLSEEPRLRDAWHHATGARGDAISWIARALLRDVAVQPGAADSNVLEIEVAAHEPETAARLANGFAAAYLHTVAELRTPSTRKSGAVPALPTVPPDDGLRSARAALMAYRPERGPSSVNGRARLEPLDLASDSPSQSAPQGRVALDDAALLSEAVAPAASSDPGLTLIAAIAIALGGALGVLCVLCRDFVSPRVRDARDLDALQLDHLVTLEHARLARQRPGRGSDDAVRAAASEPTGHRSTFSAWMAQ